MTKETHMAVFERERAPAAAWRLLLALFALLPATVAPAADGTQRPLPLASSWNTGQLPSGFTPAWQLEMIEKGHHLLLTMSINGPDAPYNEAAEKYYGEALESAKRRRLPISFVSPDFEYALYADSRYAELPPDENPCWVDAEKNVHKAVSPFGPVRHWRELGRRWSASPLMKQLQAIYADPPYVLILSNNDAARLSWKDAEQDFRYARLRAKTDGSRREPDALKRKLVGDGYIERYSALLSGMREGFGSWRERVIIGAHGRSPLKWMGRTDDWLDGERFVREALNVPGRPVIDPHIWEAVSVRQYLTTWNANTDYHVFSPQTAAMNRVLEKQLYEKTRPDIWWEVSVWDAAYHGRNGEVIKPQKWRAEGQSVPPERFGGLARWLMWMPRANVVRFFRFYHETREPTEQFPGMQATYEQVIAAVDEVHRDPLLARFWRGGRLVPNTARKHPYRHNILPEFADAHRWFQLDCDANPPWPWHAETEVTVWSFAQQIGEKPNREWLVYAFAPKGARPGVNIEVPEYGTINVTATQSGSWHHVRESAPR